MEFYTKYKRPVSPSITFSEPSLADQSQKDDCDVNKIMQRYRETGFLTDPLHPGSSQPLFGDFSDLPDYQACLEKLNAADAAFATLPASVRDRFENNPQKLFDFLSDEKNLDEAVQLGLCNPRPVKEAVPQDKPADKGEG